MSIEESALSQTKITGKAHMNDTNSNGIHGDTVQGKENDVVKKLGDDERVGMKRQLTLMHTVAVIVGTVIGSGIFISPKGVTRNVGSVGVSLIIWTIGGLINILAALCYAELGTIIPKTGGDYYYVYDVFGPLLGFMSLWANIVIVRTASLAILSRTVGTYLIQLFFNDCGSPGVIVTLVALWSALTLSFVNAYNVKLAARVQSLFTLFKLLALAIIIVTGFVELGRGNNANFVNAFEGSRYDVGSLALGIYAAFYAYAGWEAVTSLAEEIIEPEKNLPKAVWISMITVTGVYVLSNVSYFTVMTPQELVSSNAVALTFAQRTLSGAAWIMSLFVAASCFGSINGAILSNARYIFAGGREGQFPTVFAMVNVKYSTPMLGVAGQAVLVLAYCFVSDISAIMQYLMVVRQIRYVMSVSVLLFLRWKKPDIERPIKVNLILVIFVYVVMIALIIMSFISNPVPSAIGLAVFCTSVPVYFLRNMCHKTFCTGYMSVVDRVSLFLQQLFLSCPEDTKKDE
ncbi:unnamed protein product [Owenia fusiformis]|uniref:Uncharacterized protein n=1 Tax=Owenia fusiformis TaxID=6347 RepID=A0A8J1UGS4_OWEFU|nr:unnamed protein product [Owenia fusiformis]